MQQDLQVTHMARGAWGKLCITMGVQGNPCYRRGHLVEEYRVDHGGGGGKCRGDQIAGGTQGILYSGSRVGERKGEHMMGGAQGYCTTAGEVLGRETMLCSWGGIWPVQMWPLTAEKLDSPAVSYVSSQQPYRVERESEASMVERCPFSLVMF